MGARDARKCKDGFGKPMNDRCIYLKDLARTGSEAAARSDEGYSEDVLEYLRYAGILWVRTGAKAEDFFTGEEIDADEGIRTDGAYYWPDALAHHLAKYQMSLPSDFAEYLGYAVRLGGYDPCPEASELLTKEADELFFGYMKRANRAMGVEEYLEENASLDCRTFRASLHEWYRAREERVRLRAREMEEGSFRCPSSLPFE